MRTEIVIKAMSCVICATDVEYQNIIKYFDIHNQLVLEGSYLVSICYSPPCIIVRSGIGKKAAYKCLISILKVHQHISLVFSVGIAGALVPYLNIGDIVCGNYIIDYDGHSCIEEKKVICIERECKLLMETIYCGKIVSSNVMVHSEKIKQELCITYQGMCVEMESAGIVRVCELRKIPITAIKIISDYANEGAVYKILKSQIRVCNKLGFLIHEIINTLHLLYGPCF